jgi:hypothetical protein
MVHRTDLIVGAALCIAAVSAVWMQSGRLDPQFASAGTVDTWFDADTDRAVRNMTDPNSNFDNARNHPYSALLLLPPTLLVKRAFGLGSFEAVRVTIAATAGVWVAAFFTFCRLIGLRRSDAVLACLLASSTAAAVFWFAMPETHPLGSVSVVLAMVVVAACARAVVPAAVVMLVSSLTLGTTVTNWMAGLLMAKVRRSWMAWAAISMAAFVMTVGLWSVANALMPSTSSFLSKGQTSNHLFMPEAGGVVAIATAFFSHTIIMPAIEVVDRPGAGEWPVMTIQRSRLGSAGRLNALGVVVWFALFSLGLVALIRQRELLELRWFLLLLLVGQFALHIAFGAETFLYSVNFLPVLLAIAVLPFVTRTRTIALGLTVALIAICVINNSAQWKLANSMFAKFPTLHHSISAEKASRPDDPWPRTGRRLHISGAGTRPLEQGVHLLGGSFSPGNDQFTVEFWVLAPDGSLIATSDDIDVSLVAEAVEKSRGAGLTAVTTETPYYRSKWSEQGPRRFRLDLSLGAGSRRFVIAIRSVGPESGPIRTLEWDGRNLIVNNRWLVGVEGASVHGCVGVERKGDWKTATCDEHWATTPNGWGVALLEILSGQEIVVSLADREPTEPLDRPLAQLK